MVIKFELAAWRKIQSHTMAKRPVFQYRMPRAKMPKLNITISSSQQGPSNMLPPQRQQDAPTVVHPQQSEDMWPDDDDDELIMLASQAAEKVEAHAEIVLSEAMGDKLNYDNFRREVQASTQLSGPSNMLDDFMCVDENVFADIPECDIAPKTVAQPKPKPAPTTAVTENERGLRSPATVNGRKDTFAVPSTSAAAKNPQPVGELPAATSTSAAVTKNQIENAKITAQNTFLSNRMRDQKKEIENLKETLAKLNEKCQTKEGEVIDTFY